MSLIRRLEWLLHLSPSQQIARRYFVVNGFDGALTMLGLLMGFYVSENTHLNIAITVCFAAAIALGISGISSAYLSEAAEKRHELKALEEAMIRNLENSAHGQAARIIPLLIALVNGTAPFIISLVIITPLIVGYYWPGLIEWPVEAAMLLAFLVIFFLGVFLGKISGSYWLWYGIRTVLLALVTVVLIFFLTPVR